jgi:hypothetical protein
MFSRSARLVLSLGLCLAMLAGCGSSTTAAPQPAPVSACRLLTQKEVASVFQANRSDLLRGTHVIDDQTECGYSGTHEGVLLTANVSWFKKSLANVARGFSRPESSTTLPPNEFQARVVYTRLTVDGVPTYWLPRTPVSGSTSNGATPPNSNMVAIKHGYVVTLNSTGLSETQDVDAMAIMLRHL